MVIYSTKATAFNLWNQNSPKLTFFNTLEFKNRIRVHLFSKPYHTKNIIAWVISAVSGNTDSSGLCAVVDTALNKLPANEHNLMVNPLPQVQVGFE